MYLSVSVNQNILLCYHSDRKLYLSRGSQTARPSSLVLYWPIWTLHSGICSPTAPSLLSYLRPCEYVLFNEMKRRCGCFWAVFFDSGCQKWPLFLSACGVSRTWSLSRVRLGKELYQPILFSCSESMGTEVNLCLFAKANFAYTRAGVCAKGCRRQWITVYCIWHGPKWVYSHLRVEALFNSAILP